MPRLLERLLILAEAGLQRARVGGAQVGPLGTEVGWSWSRAEAASVKALILKAV